MQPRLPNPACFPTRNWFKSVWFTGVNMLIENSFSVVTKSKPSLLSLCCTYKLVFEYSISIYIREANIWKTFFESYVDGYVRNLALGKKACAAK